VRATVDGFLTQSDRGQALDARDGGSYVLYNPGVPMDVDYYWTLPAGAVKDGQKFWVGVYQRRHVQSDPVFGSSSLTGVQAMAVVDLRMKDSR
jgi:cytochrome c-type biogenesis protein CcmH/NrfF